MNPPRGWRRVLLAGVLLVLLVLVVGTGWIFGQVPRDRVAGLTPGRLSVADSAVGSWRVGVIEVTLDSEQLRVVDVERDLLVWQSQPGAAFALGILGEVEWEESLGSFWPDSRPDCVLADQEVRSVTDDSGRVEISGFVTGCGGEEREVLVEVGSAGRGDVRMEVSIALVDGTALVSGRSDGAGVHGFGEQFAPFDLSGRVLPIVVREQGVGRGEQPITVLADLTRGGAGGTEATTYAAWPSFVTEDVRGLALEPGEAGTHAFGVADLRDPGSVVLASWDPRMTARLTAAERPLDLLAARGDDTQRPSIPVLPGAVLAVQGGTKAVRQAVREVRRADGVLSAVWLQDWTGRRTTTFGEQLWWTWQLDAERYPGWDRLVADLALQDIDVLTYMNPFLVDLADKPLPTKPKAAAEAEAARNLYAEAAEAGYLVKDADGQPYQVELVGFDAALVDLTNPAAQDWYADVVAQEVLGLGVGDVAGFMADFGEGLPFDAVLARGQAELEHNRWPARWAETVREGCLRAGEPECLVWFRSGSAGMEADAPLFWAGDQLVTYGPEDGMASALLGMLSAGVSGWPLVHSDVGGYTSADAKVRDYVRPPEMNQRWAEMEAFGAFMRTHETNRPAENPQVYDPDGAPAFAAMTRLHAALAPYREAVLAEAVEDGVPALRHTWLQYPRSAAAQEPQADRQFFFGGSILVAPVLGEGQDRVDVAFPPGQWVHLLTGERYRGAKGGGTVSVPAPLGTPAAFVRTDDPERDDLLEMVAEARLGEQPG